MNTHDAIVYLNGEFMPLGQACVPVLDRGFLLGDGVYEVIPVYGGHLFRLAQHLQRLRHSLESVRIADPLTPDEWSTVLHELVALNSGGDQSVYLQVTRGVATKRDHAFPRDVTPTIFLMSNPLPPADSDITESGIAAITLEDIRWNRCDIKAITLLANVLLRQQALDENAAEAILIREGYATEGAASNLFMVKDGVLVTPPKGPQLLPGITRDLILELANENDIANREASIPANTLAAADEIWLTSSTREVLAVTSLNGNPVGSGRPGPVWSRMREIYRDYKNKLRDGLGE
jgi:D-alanine transaminase